MGVNFFGGGTDVSDVDFGVVAEVVDVDDDVAVEVDLGVALRAAGGPEILFQGKLEAGTFSFVGLLLDSGRVVLFGVEDTDETDPEFRIAKLEVLESPTAFFTGL